MSDTALTTLRDTFGFPGFRPGQEAVVRKLLAGQSVLAIFPTGGGKSLCYQLPALLFEGLTVVVSPLIALMKDQLDFLIRHDVPAARLDSTLTADEARKVLDELKAGRLKLLYLSPERLAAERTRILLKRRRISLMAIDESHCISEWGHNFRPDYLKLAELARELQASRVLALTATATPQVARDIAHAFAIADEAVVRRDFYRPNLNLTVTPCTPTERQGLLEERLAATPGAAVVYVTLQRTAEEVAARLASQGLPARPYHAGLDVEVRAQTQDWFMAASRAVVVATIAFGMGIDKADIRAVFHYNLPKSLENYAQEIGRAGRDDRPACCELFACEEDRVPLENFIFGDTPTAQAVASLLEEVLAPADEFDLSAYDLSGRYDIRPLVIETLLTYLELEGVLAATNPFFSEYKLQWRREPNTVFRRFDSGREAFLRKLFTQGRMGKTWLTIDTTTAAAAIGEPRQRAVAALAYLEEQGDIVLQASGSRLGYRRLPGAVDARDLTARLTQRFLEREQRDLARLHQVLEYAARPGCQTQYLLAYFGETASRNCGHCGWCRGDRPTSPPRSAFPPLGRREAAMVKRLRSEKLAALASPRQATRFLCGLTSPATTRARLGRHELFGALSGVPFQDVMRVAEMNWG